MAYRLIITQDIKKQLKELPGHIRSIARQEIANLIDDPRPQRSKELSGHPGHVRAHITTKYRLVWFVNDDSQSVEIEYIGPKSPELYAVLGLARPDQAQ